MAGFTPPTSLVPDGPAAHAFAITPSNTIVFGNLTRMIYVGGAGDLAVLHAGDTNPVTYTAVPVGTWLPICAQKVMATNTTATLIIGMW
jgi:hypothetical protein